MRHRVIFQRWIYSYGLILLIPIVISSLVYVKSGKITEYEINRANSALLRQVQQVIDNRIELIKRMALQIALDPNVTRFVNMKESYQDEDLYSISQTLTFFKEMNARNELDGRFYVYFKRGNFVLSDSTFGIPINMHQIIHSADPSNYARWIELMGQKHSGKFMNMMRADMNGQETSTIAYVQSLPMQSPVDSFATMVIMLDESSFQESIHHMKWIQEGNVMIVDNENKIVTTTGDKAAPLLISYDELTESSGILYRKIDGEKVVVAYTKSEAANWKFVSVLPASVFLESASYIRNLTIMGLVICIVLGALATYYFARRNYHPIDHMIQVLSGKSRVALDTYRNEYQYILGVVDATMHESEKVDGLLKKQNKMLRVNFLARLSKGRLKTGQTGFSTEDGLQSYDLYFPYENFAVMLFYIEDVTKLFKDREDVDAVIINFEFIQHIIQNIVEEITRYKHQGYVFEVDGMMACLVNLNSSDADEVKTELLDIVDEARYFIENRFHIRFTVSLSRSVSGISCLPEAYAQALEAMEYKWIIGTNQVIHYDELGERAKEHQLSYSLEKEYQLINRMKVGDFAQAEAIVLEWFEVNFSERNISIEMAKCLMFDMVCTMMKTIDEIEDGYKLVEKLELVPRLLQCKTVLDMKNNLLELLQQVCLYAESKKKSHNSLLKNKILNYLDIHFVDAQLSISSLAEHFRMNKDYLSRFFKEQTGVDLLSHINALRIGMAKELLAGGCSINDTASRTGYYHSNTFIRVFKKHEGITPGKYKELCEGKTM